MNAISHSYCKSRRRVVRIMILNVVCVGPDAKSYVQFPQRSQHALEAALVGAAGIAHEYARWLDPIIGRMVVEHARDLSDAEIQRTLDPCVGGPRLVVAAKAMRDCGMLTLASLESMR